MIIEFAGQPLFIASRESPGAQIALSPGQYVAQFSRFAADVDAILMSHRSAPADRVVMHHRYHRVFSGVSMTLPAWMVPFLQQLPYVKRIHPDRDVRTMIDPSIELIGATSVWATFGSRGEGIRVGIIDTGIDYLHPALGGGFGPGFKVAGGYDVVNSDDDPMDDNGHGTHVSGIVAADAESVKGVAPHATLYAYKVLDASGHGLDSDVLEAIERTVDPDGDGDDADMLDVVNVSLGSNEGSPTDPTSVAVDNAVRLGVVFCVAAGNSGGRTPVQGKEDNYFFDGSATIGSPGTAERAITVGASDMSDTIARFSSRGPNRVSFGIKPDVLAPGVQITSTWPGAGMKTMNGTSMATPMIAGVAALLKSLHPAWSPDFIKSAIVNSAKNIELSAYLQGGGRVQAMKAASATTLAGPSTLGYGLDDPAVATWNTPSTIVLHNMDSVSRSYTVVVEGTRSGISLEVSPSSFSIPPGDSLSISATLSVNNSAITIENENILRFTGTVAFNGTIDTVRVPWAFVRTNRLVITTSEPDAFFLGYSNASAILSTSGNVNWTDPTRAEVYAPVKGTYEFFTLFRNPAGTSKIVIDEAVSIASNAAEVFLNGAEAVHPLIYRGVDHAGRTLGTYRAPQRALITSFPNFGDWITTLPGGSDTLLLSPVSGSHVFKPVEFQFDLVETKTFHAVQFDTFTGMTGPRTVVNAPSDFIQEHFRVNVPPGTPSATGVMMLYAYTDAAGTGLMWGIGFDMDTVSIDHDEYTFTGYFGKSSSATRDLAVRFYTSYSDPRTLPIDYESPVIMPYRDSIVAVAREFVTPAVPRFAGGSTMSFGGSPPHLLMLWYNNTFGTNTLHFRTLFRGPLRESRNHDIAGGSYMLFDGNGAQLLSGSLTDPREPLALAAERYRMVVTSDNHWLRNTPGTLTLTSEFDLGAALPAANPPSITSFMVLDRNGHPADALEHNEQGRLLFSVNVVNFSNDELPIVDSTKAWYRIHGTSPWIPLGLLHVADIAANEGILMQADLDEATSLDSVAVDLKVASKGLNGFTVDQVLSPAFAVGNWDATPTGVGTDPGRGVAQRFSLEQNFPNPFNPSTVIRYRLAAMSTVVLKIYDVLGCEVATLVNEKKGPGEHAVTWNASSKSSGVYFCRIQAGSYTGTKKLLLLK
jgi:hypothetical protein